MSKATVMNSFKTWLEQVSDISKAGLSPDETRKKLNVLFDGLEEEVYIANFPKIVSIIQRSKEKCEKFADTPEQVANILSQFPRLKDNEELLTLFIQERRKNYHLPDRDPVPEKATPEEIQAQDNPQRGIAIKRPRFGRSYKWNSPQLKKKSQIYDWASLAMLVLVIVLMQFVKTVPAYGIVIPLIIAVGLQVYGFSIKKKDRIHGGTIEK